MKMPPQIYALVAAILFGISIPFSKLLLNNLHPLQLSGLLYWGSSIGLGIIHLFLSFKKKEATEKKRIAMSDLTMLLLSTIAGGIIAPALLLYGLKATPASTASVLLTLESVATTILAWAFFHEKITGKIWIAVTLITMSGVFLSLDPSAKWGISYGALFIFLACLMWGFDNNFSSKIRTISPRLVVIVKSGIAGTFLILLSIFLGHNVPQVTIIYQALLLGFLSYGLSLTCFMISLRIIGASQTTGFFGSAPFIGAGVSLLVFWQLPSSQMIVGLPLLGVGVILLLKENHSHLHLHLYVEHDHRHVHNDLHHNHAHVVEDLHREHAHKHAHVNLRHEHDHTHNPHHKHEHD